MKERPILFNGEMVKAILDGRKTQSRRVISDKVLKCFEDLNPDVYGNGIPSYETEMGHEVSITDLCPFGQVGDLLWVRETWAVNEDDVGYVYRADDLDWESFDRLKWKPSIHMPRKASRITLEITGVRVEKLNDISEKDAIAEGIGYQGNAVDTIGAFSDLWDSIYRKKHPWASNPWVWCLSFSKVNQ